MCTSRTQNTRQHHTHTCPFCVHTPTTEKSRDPNPTHTLRLRTPSTAQLSHTSSSLLPRSPTQKHVPAKPPAATNRTDAGMYVKRQPTRHCRRAFWCPARQRHVAALRRHCRCEPTWHRLYRCFAMHTSIRTTQRQVPCTSPAPCMLAAGGCNNTRVQYLSVYQR